LDVRAEVLAFVARHPGVHEREVERRLNLSGRLAGYHLAALEESGSVKRYSDGQYSRYVVAGLSLTARELRALSALRKPMALQIAVLLLDRGPMRHADIAQAVSLAKASISYHLDHLRKASIVSASRSGRETIYAIDEPVAAKRLVECSEPFVDDLGAFARIWLDLTEG
jgi:predicted transcriptional regulator